MNEMPTLLMITIVMMVVVKSFWMSIQYPAIQRLRLSAIRFKHLQFPSCAKKNLVTGVTRLFSQNTKCPKGQTVHAEHEAQ